MVQERIQQLEQKIQKKREEIASLYSKRLTNLLLSSKITGNIKTNCKSGFPLNHNVEYTWFLPAGERDEIEYLLKELIKLKK